MPQVEVNVLHHLEKNEAFQRLEQFFAEMKREYGDELTDLQEDWQAEQVHFDFRIKGLHVHGTAKVDRSAASVSMKVPLAALPWKSKIAEEVEVTLRRIYGPKPESPERERAKASHAGTAPPERESVPFARNVLKSVMHGSLDLWDRLQTWSAEVGEVWDDVKAEVQAEREARKRQSEQKASERDSGGTPSEPPGHNQREG